MAKVSEMIVQIGADIKGFEKEFGKLQKSLQTVGTKLKDTGKTLTKGLTAPLVGLGTASVMTYASFEKSMNKVRALSGATGKDFEDLESLARELGATTKFSASEAADGMAFLAMAGFDTNQIIGTMPALLDLAAAAQMDLGAAADITTNIMSGFGIEAEEAGRVADVLALASSSANTDVHGMGEAMKYVAPVANALGISIEETAAAVGFMADAGIQGSQAGTALRAGLSRLVNPVGEAKDAMEELGWSAIDADGNFKSLETILAELEDKTADMTEAQRAQTLSMLFGQEAASGWIAMLERGSDELGTFTGELENSEGAAKKMAEIMGEGLAGAWVQLLSALEGLAISFGEILAPAVQAVIEMLTKAVGWFNSLDEGIKRIIVIVGAVLAAIGPLLIALGTMAIMTSKVIPFLAGLAKGFLLSISPLLIKIALIGALVAAIIYLWNTSESFREIVIAVFNAIRDVIMQVVDIVVSYVMDMWGNLVSWWNEHNQMIIEAAQNVWNFLVTVIQTAADIIWSIMQFLWPFVQALVIDTWNAIKGAIQAAIGVITGIIELFSAMFTGNWSAMWEAVKKIVSNAVKLVWNLIQLWFVGKILKAGKALFTGLRGIVTSLWNTVKSIFMGGVNAIRNTVTAGFNFIRSIISTVMNGIRSIISNIWNAIRSRTTTVVNAIRDTIRNIFNSLRGIVSNAFTSVKNAVKSGIEGALNIIKGMFSSFKNAGKNIVTSIADGIKGAIGAVTGAIDNVVQKVRDFLPFSPAKEGPLDDIHRLNFEGPISDSIRNAIPKVQGMLTTMLTLPDINNSSSMWDNAVKQQEVNVSVDPLENRPVYLVTADGRVLAEYVTPEVTRIQDRNKKIEGKFNKK